MGHGPTVFQTSRARICFGPTASRTSKLWKILCLFHKNFTDSIDLAAVMGNFIKVNERRMKYFGY